MDNHHFSWENPLWMAIFNSYVSHYQRVIFSQTPELKYSQTSQASHPIKSWALSEECGTPKATTTNDLRMLPKWYNRVNGLPVTCHSCGNSWDSFRNDPWILPHLCELLGVFHQYAINISQKKPLYPDVFPIFIHQLPSRTQTWQRKITISIDSFPHLKRGISQPRLHWAPWTDDLEGCRPLRRCRSCRPHREKNDQWIGLKENLQESPILNWKIHGFRLRCSLKPIQPIHWNEAFIGKSRGNGEFSSKPWLPEGMCHQPFMDSTSVFLWVVKMPRIWPLVDSKSPAVLTKYDDPCTSIHWRVKSPFISVSWVKYG